MTTIEKIFKATEIIEQDGVDGIHTVADLVGKETAVALLIAHLRRSLGSMESFPSDPCINDKVVNFIINYTESATDNLEFNKQIVKIISENT